MQQGYTKLAKKIFRCFIIAMITGISNYNKSPNFTGYKSSFSKSLEKQLQKRDYTRLDEHNLLIKFSDMYDKKVKLKSKLGSGFYGTVYKIDDNYVLKRGNEKLIPEFGGIEIIKKGKFSHLKHYFGEAIAQIFNNNGEDMTIMKNVYTKGKSIPVGIPNDYCQTHTAEENLKYYNEVYLPKFAKLPQRSFDGIAKDFSLLNEMCRGRKYYTFDYINPNNFVLAGKTLRILDDINEDFRKTKNCVTDMLEVFLNKMDMDKNAEFNERLIPLRKELTKKLILAGIRHKVPMCQSKTDFVVWKYTFNDLLDMKMPESGIESMTSILDNIAQTNNNSQKRVELAKQYLEKIINL